jgi:hypothetical protein
VAPGPGGDVSIAGLAHGAASGIDILTLKYSGLGTFRWAKSKAGDADGGDWADALVAVRGWRPGRQWTQTTGNDAVLLKYKP